MGFARERRLYLEPKGNAVSPPCRKHVPEFEKPPDRTRKREPRRAVVQCDGGGGGGASTEAALTPGVLSVNYGAAELVQLQACHAETGGS